MARRRWSFFMGPLEHGGLRRLDDLLRGRFTPAGRLLVAAVVVGALLVVGGVTPLLLAACASSAALLLVATVAGALFVPRVRLVRHLPDPARAGATLHYRVTVTNLGRRPIRQLWVEERNLPAELRPVGEPPVIDRLEPGGSVEVRLQLACRRRGAYELSRLQAGSSFPSALCKWGRAQADAQRLTVLPAVCPTPLPDLPAAAGRGDHPASLAAPANSGGERTLWAGLRPWSFGDRLADLHAPAMARTGRPWVRSWSTPRRPRVALVVDLCAPRSTAQRRLESLLAHAAAVVESLHAQGSEILLVLAGSTPRSLLSHPGASGADDLLCALACAEPQLASAARVVRDALTEPDRPSSAVWLLTPREASGALRWIEAATPAGVPLRVGVVVGGGLETALPPERRWRLS